MFATLGHTAQRTVIGAFGTLFFAGICLTAAAGPAKAQELAQPRTEQVRTADLNLAKAEGRATLNHRIKSAARNVCATGSRDLGARLQEDRCERAAIAAAAAETRMAANIG